MKRVIYIILFTILGILLQFLAHALLETWYANLLLADFVKYSFGLSWEKWWYVVHGVGSVALLVAGAVFGFWQGRYWWERIYMKH